MENEYKRGPMVVDARYLDQVTDPYSLQTVNSTKIVAWQKSSSLVI